MKPTAGGRVRPEARASSPAAGYADYHVVEAKHISGYVVRIKFRDGTEGEIDLGPELVGPVFELLRDQEHFRRFHVHPEFHTLVWPNGADFAPEFLYKEVRVTA